LNRLHHNRPWSFAAGAALSLFLVGVPVVVLAAQGGPAGFLEICKQADGPAVTGDFDFTVGGRTVTVPVGACSAAIALPAGPATITEVLVEGTSVSDIRTSPAERLVSRDLAGRVAQVTVVAGDVSAQTTVTFTNRAELAPLKICKVAGTGVAVGADFTFAVGTVPVSVPAGPAPGGYCVVAGSFPVATNVAVSEVVPRGVQVSAIAVAPADRLVGGANTSGATVSVRIGTGVTEATFTNQVTPATPTTTPTTLAPTTTTVPPTTVPPTTVPPTTTTTPPTTTTTATTTTVPAPIVPTTLPPGTLPTTTTTAPCSGVVLTTVPPSTTVPPATTVPIPTTVPSSTTTSMPCGGVLPTSTTPPPATTTTRPPAGPVPTTTVPPVAVTTTTVPGGGVLPATTVPPSPTTTAPPAGVPPTVAPPTTSAPPTTAPPTTAAPVSTVAPPTTAPTAAPSPLAATAFRSPGLVVPAGPSSPRTQLSHTGADSRRLLLAATGLLALGALLLGLGRDCRRFGSGAPGHQDPFPALTFAPTVAEGGWDPAALPGRAPAGAMPARRPAVGPYVEAGLGQRSGQGRPGVHADRRPGRHAGRVAQRLTQGHQGPVVIGQVAAALALLLGGDRRFPAILVEPGVDAP
jgi:hypothetical protein